MDHISELENILSQFFDWHKARLTCLVQILCALFRVRTVNLTQIATAFQTHCKEESAYRRVRRFFASFFFDISLIVPLILRLFPLDEKYLLILDRTNWKWGKTPINILMLSVAYRGIGIPLFWSVLDLEGNSCPEDRISLIKKTLERFGVDKIEALVADREFVGKKWLSFLREAGIPFVIRTKGGYMADGIDQDSRAPLHDLCKCLGRKRKLINHQISLWGHELYVSIHRKKNTQEPLIVIASEAFSNPLNLYKKRWEIETLFGCLKTRGYRLEDTHVTDVDRVERMVFVLALAFCWAYRTGEFQTLLNPISIKTHGRRAKSVFRVGMDFIRRILLGPPDRSEQSRWMLLCFCHLKPGACDV